MLRPWTPRTYSLFGLATWTIQASRQPRLRRVGTRETRPSIAKSACASRSPGIACAQANTTPRGRLAYVIVLDQLSRNMFRNSARAFEGDEQALEAAERGIELGHDRALRGDERVFLYMPFQHAESLAVQERGVALYRAFRDETHGALREHLTENVSFAERHRDIIAQWGRFPHRNAVLGRESSAEERDFLEQPGSSF